MDKEGWRSRIHVTNPPSGIKACVTAAVVVGQDIFDKFDSVYTWNIPICILHYLECQINTLSHKTCFKKDLDILEYYKKLFLQIGWRNLQKLSFNKELCCIFYIEEQ